VTKSNLSSFVIKEAKNKDSDELFDIVKQFVYRNGDGATVTVDMTGKEVTLDQIKLLRKQIGFKGCQNSSKFNCLVMIALAAKEEDVELETESTRQSDVNCCSGHCCKFTNCLFHANHHDNYF